MPPSDVALPDLIVIGDSHSNALVEGCQAHGLRVEMLRFTGNFWHAGLVGIHRDHGLAVRGVARSQAQVAALRQRLGGLPVLSRKVPVLTTAGYHLGRVVPPLGFNGHVTAAAEFEADPEALYASRAMVEAWMTQARAPHLHLVRRMARMAEVTVVVPPHLFGRPNYAAAAQVLTAMLRRARLRVFDPAARLAEDGRLPAHLLTPDGTHGNADYGARVVGMMLDEGLIRRAA